MAPVSDVSALVQDMLSWVAAMGVPLTTQLSADIYSFLMGLSGARPVAGEVESIHGRGVSAPPSALVGSQLRLGPPLAGVSALPLAVSSACR